MQQVSPNELRKWNEDGRNYLLIDIREDWERTNYNIGGLHIPMGALFTMQQELPRDKDIVLYCEKGVRSVIAIQRLEEAGFHNLFNLAGGMYAWRASL